MPQTLTQIKALLDAAGLRPKKRYGQNFLHDANQMDRIVAAARLEPGQVVLEVGPGTGALSERLLEAGVRLIAVEVDRGFEPILRKRLVDRFGNNVRLLFTDVLADKHRVAPRVIETVRGFDAERFSLVANLPYNIASPLLVNLAVEHREMALGVVMLQRDVADRLTAEPGGAEYGPLGIMVGAMFAVRRIGTVAPSCFWPRPKVQSAVLRLERRSRPLTDDADALRRLVHRLFTQRRKQLGTIIGRDQPLPRGIGPQMRPQQLSIRQLVSLAKAVG